MLRVLCSCPKKHRQLWEGEVPNSIHQSLGRWMTSVHQTQLATSPVLTSYLGRRFTNPSNGSKQRYRNPYAVSKGKCQTRSCKTCNIQRTAVCHQPAHLVEEYTSDALGINWNKILENNCIILKVTLYAESQEINHCIVFLKD